VSADDVSRRLRDLHDSYVDRVNRLLEEDREDLAGEPAAYLIRLGCSGSASGWGRPRS
jgi:hypothetical protein